ncbi:hypothetical protein KI387_029061, partial [Taxus chinensis]
MSGVIQCNCYCSPSAAGFEPAIRGRPRTLPRTSLLAPRNLNALGAFLSTDCKQVTGSNLIRAPNPAVRTICEAMADNGAKSIDENGVFMGLGGDSEAPVKICQTHTLPAALTIGEAVATLQSTITDFKSSPPPFESGILRFQ